MPSIIPTKQTLRLVQALEKHDITVRTEYWDGHKHVDIFLPEARMNIEIDGLQHFINPDQITADFERKYYSSKDSIYTLHITNQLIEEHLDQIATGPVIFGDARYAGDASQTASMMTLFGLAPFVGLI